MIQIAFENLCEIHVKFESRFGAGPAGFDWQDYEAAIEADLAAAADMPLPDEDDSDNGTVLYTLAFYSLTDLAVLLTLAPVIAAAPPPNKAGPVFRLWRRRVASRFPLREVFLHAVRRVVHAFLTLRPPPPCSELDISPL